MTEQHPDAPGSPPEEVPRLPAYPPEAYTERAAHARARGLKAPYIAGGTDPELAETLRRERRFVRLLLLMIVAIVAGGFVLGAITVLFGLGTSP